ncbi:hypothetical protein KSX_50650 [Ktedonospora formicarum]|uniref:Uncharacterized protein n=2 Tax=Ktedonospora formicarum TaxID=2778364 RepID=A0A8J3MSB0_9CHLR|nr:hypothetical protein KSX_50650 [Ktedonospora formicarum]
MYNDTNDTIDNTLGSFVVGPGTPPHGRGSIQFTLDPSPYNRKNIATYQFSSTSLASITQMSFGAYSHSGVAGASESPFLNFNVDFTGTSTSFQGRLVYVPSANGSVPQDTWNTFDTINGGNALWTWSRYGSNGNKWPDNNTSQYRTWNAIKAAFPNARILPGDGWLGIRVGEPGPNGYTGNVDFFTLGTTTGGTTTFDFEPLAVPQARAFGFQSTNPTTAPVGDVSIQGLGCSESATTPVASAAGFTVAGITDTVSSLATADPAIVDASSTINILTGSGIVASGTTVTAHVVGSLPPALAGSTTFALLSIPGQPLHSNYSPTPNTTLPIPGVGTVILNEQAIVQQQNRLSIQVNGLHVKITQGPRAGADIVIGHAEAIITYV